MKLKGVNSSSLKTKKKIKEEFASLVYEKQELSKITVSELVKRWIYVKFLDTFFGKMYFDCI